LSFHGFALNEIGKDRRVGPGVVIETSVDYWPFADERNGDYPSASALSARRILSLGDGCEKESGEKDFNVAQGTSVLWRITKE
jgi:hypothetical protein